MDFGYNARSELTRADRRAGEEPGEGANVSSPFAFEYAYDGIGNRLTYEVDDSGTPTAYTANDLNQYTATAGPAESFGYDADGNLTADGTYAYTWDGENRLIAVEPAGTPAAGDRKLEFAYDYMGRRVRKEVFAWDDGAGDWAATATTDLKFVYDGWNVVQVLDGTTTGDPVTRQYTWGLDLSGTVHAAGGIGGLLAVEETAAQGSPAYWYFYDANGNVGQLVNAGNQTLAAHYEYDPYGNIITADDVDSSGYVDANPIRFSTKWFDTDLAGAGVTGAVGQTGLGYWGYRYYSPRLGRWLNRDPIEEDGGLNLYQYARNDPLRNRDPSGLDACTDGCDSCGNGSTAFCFCVQKCRGTRCWIKAVECSKRAAFSYGVRCTIGCVAGYLWGTPGYKSCLKACALAAAAGRLVVVGACMDEFKACAASANAALDRCLEKAKD